MIRAAARGLSALCLILLLFSANALAMCDRVISVGDLHGAYDGFVSIMQEAGLIDSNLRWQGGDSCLVQLGDIVDRGARSRELLDLLMDLEAQAPEKVHVLLGNHEVMNMLGDLRYLSPEEFAAYADDETAEERQQGLMTFLEGRRSRRVEANRIRNEFESAHPPGWFAHRRAFAPDGRYGRWLLERPLVVMIEGTVYVHGGISPADARLDLPRINGSVTADVVNHLRSRERLIEAGVITPLTSLVDALGAAQLWLDAHATHGSPPQFEATADAARRFAGITKSNLVRTNGPLWYRELAKADPRAFEPRLEKILREMQALRIVVGHTTTESRRIARRFGDRVFVIDTGAGHEYGGQASALEISADGRIRALYPDHYETLVDPPVNDSWVEMILREGEAVESKLIGSGITRPRKIVLEHRGRQAAATFKTIDVQLTGPVAVREGTRELHFTDRYSYERAAYLLDRRLGIDMVPVTVLRTIDGKEGSLMAWVDDAINEDERRRRKLRPEDPLRLNRQRSIMRLFDALIHNIDRKRSDQLYTLDDWKLHLIDHSRTFRLQKQVSKDFLAVPIDLPRGLFKELKSLGYEELREMMSGVLTRPQIKALLARRNAIVAKIERDRKELGDAFVFRD